MLNTSKGRWEIVAITGDQSNSFADLHFNIFI